MRVCIQPSMPNEGTEFCTFWFHNWGLRWPERARPSYAKLKNTTGREFDFMSTLFGRFIFRVHYRFQMTVWHNMSFSKRTLPFQMIFYYQIQFVTKCSPFIMNEDFSFQIWSTELLLLIQVVISVVAIRILIWLCSKWISMKKVRPYI